MRWIAHVSLLALVSTASCQPAAAGVRSERPPSKDETSLEAGISRIMEQPHFRRSEFGVDVLSLETGRHVYQLNAEKFFETASTAKLLTAATALDVLGEDFCFHTHAYGSGPILNDGTLDGDLVLVASGDPNLSGRVRADGTLAFEDRDHDYRGPPIPGDPLAIIKNLALQISSRGVKRVRGRILADASLYPEHELGGYVVSPFAVNDNLIDVAIRPGPVEGSPAILTQSPATSYLKLVNRVTTGGDSSGLSVDWGADTTHADGTHEVIITGNIAAERTHPAHLPYLVREPRRFAERLFAAALADSGVSFVAKADDSPVDFEALATSYVPERVLARHVSVALSEEIKVMLKVSQNLHAYMISEIVSSQLGKGSQRTATDVEREFLDRLGIDRSGAQKGDAAGLDTQFTPEFMVSFLAKMTAHRSAASFQRALAVLGRDGTLADVQPASSAAGHVFAKTGSHSVFDPLNRRMLVTAKGLAGFMTTARGQRVAFAIYVRGVPIAGWAELSKVGDALGEIATVIYETLN